MLTTEHRWACYNTQELTRFFKSKSNEGQLYETSLSASNPGSCQFNWSCTCWPFIRNKTCDHIMQAEGELCTLDGVFNYLDNKPQDGRCPQCGGHLVPIAVGV